MHPAGVIFIPFVFAFMVLALLAWVFLATIRAFTRRRTDDRLGGEQAAQLLRTMDLLDRMEQRIDNLETILNQKEQTPESQAGDRGRR